MEGKETGGGEEEKLSRGELVSLVEREKESLVMERKWSLVVDKKVGKQAVTCRGRGSITRNLN